MREELTTEKIIENCKKFRGEEYDYSKVKKWENGEETKIEVICQHGSYWTNYFLLLLLLKNQSKLYLFYYMLIYEYLYSF